MIKITNELSLNPLEIESAQIDHRFYVNGSDSTLVITMKSGRVHRVHHGPWNNVYEIEKTIQATMQKGNTDGNEAASQT